MIEFYTTDDSQFHVSANCIFKNGEVIAEGQITVKKLLLNEPAHISVSGSNFLKTENVFAVLPGFQVRK